MNGPEGPLQVTFMGPSTELARGLGYVTRTFDIARDMNLNPVRFFDHGTLVQQRQVSSTGQIVGIRDRSGSQIFSNRFIPFEFIRAGLFLDTELLPPDLARPDPFSTWTGLIIYALMKGCPILGWTYQAVTGFLGWTEAEQLAFLIDGFAGMADGLGSFLTLGIYKGTIAGDLFGAQTSSKAYGAGKIAGHLLGTALMVYVSSGGNPFGLGVALFFDIADGIRAAREGDIIGTIGSAVGIFGAVKAFNAARKSAAATGRVKAQVASVRNTERGGLGYFKRDEKRLGKLSDPPEIGFVEEAARERKFQQYAEEAGLDDVDVYYVHDDYQVQRAGGGMYGGHAGGSRGEVLFSNEAFNHRLAGQSLDPQVVAYHEFGHHKLNHGVLAEWYDRASFSQRLRIEAAASSRGAKLPGATEETIKMLRLHSLVQAARSVRAGLKAAL